jgi:hypothetical protein
VEDGRLLYVQPGAFSVSGEEILLAGTPNLLTRLKADGSVASVAEDSVLGAVIGRDGRARTVAAPIDGRLIDGVRASARAGGGWDVTFVEVKPYTGSARPDTAARLWYGTYDGQRWSGLERLPLPEHGVIHPELVSSLVRRGDSLAWAMTLMTPRAWHVSLLERGGGQWSHEIIPTRHARVELARSDTLGLLLLVVQPDTTLPRDGNSLFLWGRRPGWQRLRRLVHGSGDGRVYDPRLDRSGSGDVLTWKTPALGDAEDRSEARAMVGRVEVRNETVVTVDSAISGQSRIAHVTLADGRALWITDHPLPGRRDGELRFTSLSRGSPVVLGRIPSPYMGFTAAVPVGPAELLVTGLHYIPNRYLVSLLIRARLECPPGA